MDRPSTSVPAALLLGLCLAGGLVGGGLAVASAASRFREGQRHVTVKGLAEREVDADLAIWPIPFKETGDDLVDLQRRIDAKRAAVVAFLERGGFRAEDVSFAAPRIQDVQAERPDARPGALPYRYAALAVVTLRSRDVPGVRRAMESAGTLVRDGVMIVQDWENRPQFLFTGLNAVKPAMIEEATVAARQAAAQFAKDSGSSVGKIRTASQGLFTITDRDPNSPERKVVRVVTTVEYFLDD